MECLAQIGERARRSDHDQGVDAAIAHDPLQHGCDLLGEPVLLKVVPIGLADAGTHATDRRECSARPIRPLFVGCGISVGEHALGLEIEELGITLIAEHERLAAVADENKCIMGNSEHWTNPVEMLWKCCRTRPSADTHALTKVNSGGAAIVPQSFGLSKRDLSRQSGANSSRRATAGR